MPPDPRRNVRVSPAQGPPNLAPTPPSGQPLFLGVDVAGRVRAGKGNTLKGNTWICGLTETPTGLHIPLAPQLMTLRSAVHVCETQRVLGVAIDAQLSIAIDDEDGFRSSDEELKKELRLKGLQNRVLSFNGTRAVTVRGRLLAEALGPLVGTVLETHPLAALYLTL